jgi:phosphoesterase RecJ-like protein
MTDTGSFRFSSVSAETHEIVALLLSKGARNYVVHEKIYDTSSEWRLRFLGHSLLNRMVVVPEYHTVYFTALKDEMEAYHHQSGDTEGLVNYGLSITGMKMAVLFSERDKVVKISFRSKGDFSVKDLAEKHFEGGGHKNAAGGKSTESIDETVKRFVSILPNYSADLK